MDSAQEAGTPNGTIAPAGTVAVTLAVGASPNIAILIKNTGLANNITLMTVDKSPRGVLSSPDSDLNSTLVADGDLAPGSTRLIELTGNVCKTLVLTLGSTLGTLYAVEWAAGH